MPKILNILRRILTKEGLDADPQKIDDIINWPRLETRVQTQQFMGIVNYCSQFLPELSRIAEPMLRLTGKTQEFYWNLACERSFKQIKDLARARGLLRPLNYES